MEYLRTLRNNNVIYSCTRSTYNQQTTSDFSIRFVFSGNERYNIGKRQLSIYTDSFLTLNKGTHYSSTVESAVPVQAFGISFDDKFLQDFKNSWQLKDDSLLNINNHLFTTNNRDHEFDETIYPFKGDLFFNVSHLKHHLDCGLQDELLINEYLHHCLINYFQIFNEEVFQKAQRLNFLSRSTKIEILRRLNLAKEYLYSNFNNNISLEELAEYACLSVTHLLRTFRQAFHQTPHQFLVQIRLQRARDLLKNTDYPVNEVVNMVGFDCPSSFIRLFKDRFQITPLKYRQSF